MWNIPEKFRFGFLFLFALFFLIGNILIWKCAIDTTCNNCPLIVKNIKNIGSVGLSSAILTFFILGVVEMLGTMWDKVRKTQYREGKEEELDIVEAFARQNGNSISRDELLKLIEKERAKIKK